MEKYVCLILIYYNVITYKKKEVFNWDDIFFYLLERLCHTIKSENENVRVSDSTGNRTSIFGVRSSSLAGCATIVARTFILWNETYLKQFVVKILFLFTLMTFRIYHVCKVDYSIHCKNKRFFFMKTQKCTFKDNEIINWVISESFKITARSYWNVYPNRPRKRAKKRGGGGGKNQLTKREGKKCSINIDYKSHHSIKKSLSYVLTVILIRDTLFAQGQDVWAQIRLILSR